MDNHGVSHHAVHLSWPLPWAVLFPWLFISQPNHNPLIWQTNNPQLFELALTYAGIGAAIKLSCSLHFGIYWSVWSLCPFCLDLAVTGYLLTVLAENMVSKIAWNAEIVFWWAVNNGMSKPHGLCHRINSFPIIRLDTPTSTVSCHCLGSLAVNSLLLLFKLRRECQLRGLDCCQSP